MSLRALRLNTELIDKAEIAAKTSMRSVPKQIEYWSQIGQVAEANPDLPYQVIHDILQGLTELDAGRGTPYQFKTRKKKK